MKQILLAFLIVFLSFPAEAQKHKKDTLNLCRPGSYVLFDLGGGMNTLSYSLKNYGNKTPGFGLMARAGYRYFFNSNWGAGIDFNVKTYSASGKFNYTNYIDGAIDQDGETYQNRTYYYYLKEKQKESMLGIPIGLFYQQPYMKKFKIGGGVGFIAQFVASEKFSTKSGYLQTRGYYSDYNLELYGMDQHYFYDASDFTGHHDFKTSLGAFGEFDFMYVINYRLDFNAGLYLTYGFNNQKDTYENPQYDPDCMSSTAYDNPKYYGVLNSNVVDKMHPFSIGVMAGLRYRLLSSNKDKKDKVKDSKPEKVKDTKPEKQKNDKNNGQEKQQIDSTKIPPKTFDDDDDDLVPHREPVPVGQPKDSIEKPVDQPVTEPNKPDEQPVYEPENPVENPTDQPKTEPEKTSEEPVTEPVIDNGPKDEVIVNLDSLHFVAVNFGFNKTDIVLQPNTSKMFDDIAKLAKADKSVKIHVVGHTCDIGTLEQNMKVGLSRAEAAKAQLVRRGVESTRITCESKAYEDPLVPNDSDYNRAKNRRVEIQVIK